MGVPLSLRLLLCNLVVWCLFLPFAWQLGSCRGGAQSGPGGSGGPGGPGAFVLSGRPWAPSLLDAVDRGIGDAAKAVAAASGGSSGKGGGALEAERRAVSSITALAPEVLANIRELVAREIAASQKVALPGRAAPQAPPPAPVADRVPAAAAQTAPPPLAGCEEGRGPVPVPPTARLTLPVLDSLGGKVVAGGENDTSRWGVPMPNLTVEVSPGRRLSLDEVVYGYDLIFEAMHLFSYVSWGRVPMQQDPNDALAIADLIGRVQPDCFVELGTNTGGGAIFYAEVMRGYVQKPLVVTIDVHVPTKNWDRFAQIACPHCIPVTCHPTWNSGLVEFVQGYTQDPGVVKKVEDLLSAHRCERTMVMHDSDHRGAQVRLDADIYHKFVSVGSYYIVQDTKLSRMRGGRYATLEAVEEFLQSPSGSNFVVDKTFEYLFFSHHHSGFLQRVK